MKEFNFFNDEQDEKDEKDAIEIVKKDKLFPKDQNQKIKYFILNGKSLLQIFLLFESLNPQFYRYLDEVANKSTQSWSLHVVTVNNSSLIRYLLYQDGMLLHDYYVIQCSACYKAIDKML